MEFRTSSRPVMYVADNPFSRDQWNRPAPPQAAPRRQVMHRASARREVGKVLARHEAGETSAWHETREAPAQHKMGKASARREMGKAPARREVARATESLRIVALVAVAGLAIFLLVAIGGAVQSLVSAAPADGPLTSAPVTSAANKKDELPRSTPVDQWRVGEVPYLYQIDPAWGDKPYAGATVAESGCGPTSLSMVYVALTGKTDYDPLTMAAFSEENGYVEDGLTSWLLMSEGAAQLGLASHEVPADADLLVAELAQGNPVICTVGPGDFTTKGHFIVLSAVDDEGKLVVHDPNSAENSARSWDVQRVINQCRNIWAFERA